MSSREPQAGEHVKGWILERHVGSGSFATVWKARKEGSASEVAAVKVIDTTKLSPKLKLSLESEVFILKRITHKNVVQLFEDFKVGNRLYLAMEFCGGGDLAAYIQRHRRVEESTARNFMQQLANGLRELWEHNFVHRDLKPQNLLLSDLSASPVIKIADFGFARDLQPERLADTLCGSPLYMAPEILQFRKYDAKADLWSVGVILYELLAGKPPFDGANHLQLLKNIERSEVKIPTGLAARLSSCCCNLIYSLLRRDAVQRISFESFFEHPFVCTGDLPPEMPQLPPMENSIYVSKSRSTLSPIAEVQGAEAEGRDNKYPGDVMGGEPVARPSSPAPDPFLKWRPSSPLIPLSHPPHAPHHARTGAGQAQGSSKETAEEEDFGFVFVTRPAELSSSSSAKVQSQSAHSGASVKALIQIPPPMSIPLVDRSFPLSESEAPGSTVHYSLTREMSRYEVLRRAALLLEEVAIRRQEHGQLADSLVFHLLSLEVLHSALQHVPMLPGEGPAASLWLAAFCELILRRSENVGNSLSREGHLPDVWDLLFKEALAMARAAGVEEVLANHPASLTSYANAAFLFYFMLTEAPDLKFKPKLLLAVEDERRLRGYAMRVARRYEKLKSKTLQAPPHQS